MTLRISLRDGAKVIVNGAVLRSVGRTNLSIESNAAILRGRDVMEPHQAVSPATRLYHACISAYVDAEGSAGHQDRIVAALSDVMATMEMAVAKAAAASFARLVAMSDYYRAFVDCRSLIAMERAAMSNSPTHAGGTAALPA